MSLSLKPNSDGTWTIYNDRTGRDSLKIISSDDSYRFAGAHTPRFFDDFLGDVVADQWNFTEGTDSGTSDGAIVALVNGVFRLTSGDSAGTVAGDLAQLNAELNWKASSGGLVFEARFSLAVISSVSCFIGFTDTKSLEQPIYSAGSVNTITTDADDAVGIFFDTAMTTTDWWMAGVKATVDATHQDSGFAPVADTYETWRIEVDTSGNATFFRNGGKVGTTVANALTASIALTPCLCIRPKSAVAGRTMDIDYVLVQSDR